MSWVETWAGKNKAKSSSFRQNISPPENKFELNYVLEAADLRVAIHNSPNDQFSTYTSNCNTRRQRSIAFSLAKVVDKQGPRICLRHLGTDDKNDIWLMVDSDMIRFYPSGLELSVPFGFMNSHSAWSKIITRVNKEEKFAPKEWFPMHPVDPGSNQFKLGEKLEAIDRRNAQLICPATISEIKRDFVLVNFEGWSGTFNYWAKYNSQDLFPVGWCLKAKHKLQQPGPHYELADKILSEYQLEYSVPTRLQNSTKRRQAAKRKPPELPLVDSDSDSTHICVNEEESDAKRPPISTKETNSKAFSNLFKMWTKKTALQLKKDNLVENKIEKFNLESDKNEELRNETNVEDETMTPDKNCNQSATQPTSTVVNHSNKQPVSLKKDQEITSWNSNDLGKKAELNEFKKKHFSGPSKGKKTRKNDHSIRRPKSSFEENRKMDQELEPSVAIERAKEMNVVKGQVETLLLSQNASPTKQKLISGSDKRRKKLPKGRKKEMQSKFSNSILIIKRKEGSQQISGFSSCLEKEFEWKLQKNCEFKPTEEDSISTKHNYESDRQFRDEVTNHRQAESDTYSKLIKDTAFLSSEKELCAIKKKRPSGAENRKRKKLLPDRIEYSQKQSSSSSTLQEFDLISPRIGHKEGSDGILLATISHYEDDKIVSGKETDNAVKYSTLCQAIHKAMPIKSKYDQQNETEILWNRIQKEEISYESIINDLSQKSLFVQNRPFAVWSPTKTEPDPSMYSPDVTEIPSILADSSVIHLQTTFSAEAPSTSASSDTSIGPVSASGFNAQTLQREKRQISSATELPSDPSQWTIDEVQTYLINKSPSLESVALEFKNHEIDGQALLLMTMDTLRQYMKIKLGPAIKVESIIKNLLDGKM